jgi:hypothetical protein
MQRGGQSANHVKRYVSRLSTLFYGLMYLCLSAGNRKNRIGNEMTLFSQSLLSLGAPDCPVVHRTVSGEPGWLVRTGRSREFVGDVRL